MYVRLDEQKEAVPYYGMVDAGCAFMPQQQAKEKMIAVLNRMVVRRDDLFF